MNWGSSPAPGPSGIGTAGTPAEATDFGSPTSAKAMPAMRQRRIGDRARPTQGPRGSCTTADPWGERSGKPGFGRRLTTKREEAIHDIRAHDPRQDRWRSLPPELAATARPV